jgi:hypothetical protein
MMVKYPPNSDNGKASVNEEMTVATPSWLKRPL